MQSKPALLLSDRSGAGFYFGTGEDMNCPNCNTTLLISDRQGIEIDYCPRCRGVWFDHGELDKLIERSASETKWHKYVDDDDDHDQYRQEYPAYKKRKKSFLGDLLDFD